MAYITFLRLSNPNLTEWMSKHKIEGGLGLYQYYTERILNITSSINISSIVWQDVWDENVQVRS